MRRLVAVWLLALVGLAQNPVGTGVAGSPAPPTGAAGGVLSGNYPNPTCNPAGGAVCVASVALQPADITALNVTPFTIVPAPGAGKYILPAGLISQDYVTGGTPFTQYGNGVQGCNLYFETPGTQVLNSNTPITFCQSDYFVATYSFHVAPDDSVVSDWSRVNQPVILKWASGAKGRIATSSLGAGGTGYAVNDTFEVFQASGSPAEGIVDAVSGGVVTAYHLTSAGTGYIVGNGIATTATSGVGVNLTINVLTIQTVAGGNGVLKISFPYTIITVPTP